MEADLPTAGFFCPSGVSCRRVSQLPVSRRLSGLLGDRWSRRDLMSRRIVTSLIGMTAMAVLGLGTAPLRAQAAADGSPKTAAASKKPASASAKHSTKHTPWGDPDLQGTWDYRTI